MIKPGVSLRGWIVGWLSLAFTCLAWAQFGALRNFDLPAGDATRTLRLFTEQSGEQILYPIDAVRGIRTHPVKGQLSALEALEVMLARTGLTVVQDPTNGALAVTRAPAPTTAAPAAPIRRPAVEARPARASSDSDPREVVLLETYIVNGMTEAMVKAQQIKRESLQVVESIVADDINKLPDLSVTEALQRVTGVSISRELGEGANVALRGLNEVTAILNGREVFSPQVVSGEARVMNLQTVPAELISAINVIKTPAADMIEGGIAGTIDIRLRRPLDFNGNLNGSLTTRLEHSEATRTSKPQYAGLITDTWNVGAGRLGALVNYTLQERDIRQDLNSNGKPVVFNAATSPMAGYEGSYEPRIVANRRREGGSAVLQWAPTPQLRTYAEYEFSTQTTRQDSVAPYITGGAFVADGATMFPGRKIFADHDNNSGTPILLIPVARTLHVVNGNFNSLSTIRDWRERTRQGAVGGRWQRDRLTIKAEVSHTQSRSDLDNLGVVAGISGINYTQDVGAEVPSLVVDDPALVTVANVANWKWSYWYYNLIVNRADATAGTIDIAQRFPSDALLQQVKWGVRVSDRSGRNYRVSTTGTFANPSVAAYPSLYRPATVTGFFDGRSGKVNDFVELATEPLRGYAGFARLIGADPVMPAADPVNLFDLTERTWATYLMGEFAVREPLRMDGNVGLRVVGTEVKADGFKYVEPTYTRLVERGRYTDFLPSLNTRWFLLDDLYLRLSVSKQLSRQPFSKLNPNVQLVPPVMAGMRGAGRGGNPDLSPLRTDQFDASIERYFSESTYLYVSGYYKKIDGYTQNRVSLETWDGVEYEMTRPYAVDGAEIKGAEIGYQQFFTRLPGWWSGLGLLANYTYVDAKDPKGEALTNLSKHGCNVILMYEKRGWTGRLAYNWRDRFPRVNNVATGLGAVTVHDRAFGWLDASLSYRLTPHLKLSIDVANALRTKRTSYFGESLFQHEDVLEDRQFYLSATWSL